MGKNLWPGGKGMFDATVFTVLYGKLLYRTVIEAVIANGLVQ